MTPQLFWKYKARLLDTDQEDLPDLIERILKEDAEQQIRSVREDFGTNIEKVNGKLSLSKNTELPFEWDKEAKVDEAIRPSKACLIMSSSEEGLLAHKTTSILCLSFSANKKGEAFFMQQLPQCLDFVGKHLRDNRSVNISCDSGKDFGPIVAIAAMQTFFNDRGELRSDKEWQRPPGKFTKKSPYHNLWSRFTVLTFVRV